VSVREAILHRGEVRGSGRALHDTETGVTQGCRTWRRIRPVEAMLGAGSEPRHAQRHAAVAPALPAAQSAMWHCPVPQQHRAACRAAADVEAACRAAGPAWATIADRHMARVQMSHFGMRARVLTRRHGATGRIRVANRPIIPSARWILQRAACGFGRRAVIPRCSNYSRTGFGDEFITGRDYPSWRRERGDLDISARACTVEATRARCRTATPGRAASRRGCCRRAAHRGPLPARSGLHCAAR